MKWIKTKKARPAGGYSQATELRTIYKVSAGYKLLPAHLPVVRSHIPLRAA